MKVHLFGRTFRLLRRLKSRKNRVYLVEDDAQRYVLKLYRSPHHLRSSREHRVLQQAYHCGLAVPRPLAFIERKALLMAHVPGENLCDLLNRRLAARLRRSAGRLVCRLSPLLRGPRWQYHHQGRFQLEKFCTRPARHAPWSRF